MTDTTADNISDGDADSVGGLDAETDAALIAGAELVARWAVVIDEAYDNCRSRQQLLAIQRNERAFTNSSEPMHRERHAIAQLDFAVFVSLLIHHRSGEKAQLKVKEVSAIVGEVVSRRQFWTKLKLGTYFAAGLALGGNFLP